MTVTETSQNRHIMSNNRRLPPPRWDPREVITQRTTNQSQDPSTNFAKRQLNMKNLHLDLSNVSPSIPLPHPSQPHAPFTAGCVPQRSLSLRSPQLFTNKMKKRSAKLALSIPTTISSTPSSSSSAAKSNSVSRPFDAKLLNEDFASMKFTPPQRCISSSSSFNSCTSSSSSSSCSASSSTVTSSTVSSDSLAAVTLSSPTSSPIGSLTKQETETLNEPEMNCDAYPEGPVCVLEPNLYLYSEPTITQINKFDVVINVAQEIKDYSYEMKDITGVEYYYIPWEHHSRLVSDFPKLTELIDKSLGNDKKVLIHCQCGISRSASLIMAYFMKINHADYNQAYHQLKEKAPLISPNLSLIYELMEWGQYLKRNQ